MESRTLSGAKESLGTAIKVADSRREIENGKEYPIYLSILGTGKNEGSFQSFQGSVSFQDGVGRISSNLYKQLGMGASLKVNGDSIELSGKDTDGFSVIANADGISILGRDKEEEELDQDPAQPTASKKEGLKHSGAKEAKDLIEKQNSAKMRKQRQDLVAESNRLIDQDFQDTIRGMNRMLRLLMFMEQMNTKAAGTLYQANSLRYAEKSKSIAQICSMHDQVHTLNRSLISLEREAQRTYEMQALKQPVSTYQFTNPDKFYNLPYYEQFELAKSLQAVAQTFASANNLDKDAVSSIFFNSLGFNVFDEKYTQGAPTDYVSFSRNVSREPGSKSDKASDNSMADLIRDVGASGELVRTRVDVDISKYTPEQIIAFLDKYYPAKAPEGATKKQRELNKDIRQFFTGIIFSRNLKGQSVDNLTLASDQIVQKTDKGYLLFQETNSKKGPKYMGKLQVDEQGIIQAYELTGGTNTRIQNAKLDALEKLREEYPEVQQDKSEHTYTVESHHSAVSTSSGNGVSFDSEFNLTPTYTCSITPVPGQPEGPTVETPITGSPAYQFTETPTDSSSTTTPYDNETDKHDLMPDNSIDQAMANFNNSISPEDLEWLNLCETPHVTPVNTSVEKQAMKSHDEVEIVCRKLAELPDKQLEEREALEATFTERTMKLVFYELKLSRTELKQQLTEEAGILSKDKSLTPTRRKQLLALKQDEIKKRQQKRLYERLMKQKLEQRQQLAKLLLKQSKERVALAELVDAKLDHYYRLLEEAQQYKVQPIDQFSKSAMTHLRGDVSSMEERCAHLYHYFMENGNTQAAQAIIEISSKLKVVKEETSRSTTREEDVTSTRSTSESSPNTSNIDFTKVDPEHVHDHPQGPSAYAIDFTKVDPTHVHDHPQGPADYLNERISTQTSIFERPEDFMEALNETEGMSENYKKLAFELFFNTGNPNVVAASKRPIYQPKAPSAEQTKPGNGPIK